MSRKAQRRRRGSFLCWVTAVVAIAAVGSFLSLLFWASTASQSQALVVEYANRLWLPRSSFCYHVPRVHYYYPSDANLPTLAVDQFQRGGQGFYNQQMAFTAVMMRINDQSNRSSTTLYQVLLPSLRFRDYLGSNKWIAFDQLFDVEHWNTFFPRLPRLVSYNYSQHFQFDLSRRAMIPPPRPLNRTNDDDDHCHYTHPMYLQDTRDSFRDYVKYYQALPPSSSTQQAARLHPTDQLLLQGALRPAPAIRAAIMDAQMIIKEEEDGNDNDNNNNNNYLALHLRVEPDFLCHHWGGTGGKRHGRNLTEIVTRMQARFGPHPPAHRVFVAVNRPLLEDESKIPPKAFPSVEECNAERQANLEALNRLVRDGMWDGRVTVTERPALVIAGKPVSHRPSLWGALVDSEFCRQAKVFVGRLDSTFALNIIRRRSAMGNLENYNYEVDWEKVAGTAYPTRVA